MSEKTNENEKFDLIIEGGLKDTNLVQKSNPLFSLWKSSLSLSEFKILDTYLSRINSREPNYRTVVFGKGELEKLLGVVKINKPDLEKRLEHLQGTILSIGEGNNIDKITLFERSQAVQDEYGLWQVKLTASMSAMKYIFNVEKIGYFRYQIRNIVNLRSLNSYILFTYFEHCMNGSKGKFKIELEVLKQMLGCTAECHSEFKEFNRLVLKKCQKEINEKTDISLAYSTIRKNRKVAFIVFEVERKLKIETTVEPSEHELSEIDIDIPNTEEPSVDETKYNGYESEEVYQYATICSYEFNNSQVKELCLILSEIDLPEGEECRTFDEYDFLSEMYYKMNRYTKDKGLDSKRRFSYLMTMLKEYKINHRRMSMC